MKTAIRESRFEVISNYLYLLISNNAQHGRQMAYTMTNQPIYRGIYAGDIKNMNVYEPGVTGQWAQFSSCTVNRKIAEEFADAGRSKLVKGEN